MAILMRVSAQLSTAAVALLAEVGRCKGSFTFTKEICVILADWCLLYGGQSSGSRAQNTFKTERRRRHRPLVLWTAMGIWIALHLKLSYYIDTKPGRRCEIFARTILGRKDTPRMILAVTVLCVTAFSKVTQAISGVLNAARAPASIVVEK